ncbi:excisionase family protein [Salinivibrio sp. KP-1]|uniref:excisionase family protein n=1 Tax=Salinivibrio sp. KP-1 TaxID=1406902 RepID=UPI0006148887|nr:excisionase family protein [Salinivibrio sp. KP-1]KKA43469.1 hypothetical protein WN56_13905 [Salinivibrio sp. KP-1]
MTKPIELVQPNDWVELSLLIKLTGLSARTIEDFRLGRWNEGVEYIRVSPSGKQNGRKIMYNRKAIDEYFNYAQRIA